GSGVIVCLRFVRRCQKRPRCLSSLLWCECHVRVVAHLQLDVCVSTGMTPGLRRHYHPRRDWRRLVPVSVDRHARIDSHPSSPPAYLLCAWRILHLRPVRLWCRVVVTAVTRQAAVARPKTARRRNSSRRHCRRRRPTWLRGTSARPRRRRLGSASHPPASPIVPVAGVPSRRSAVLW